ncbi:MAG: DUF4861 family protein [Candidatus Latescibacteria bacterium]|nr:DUF4861 family protein [Candidatus Latescibacterota bacterium]
MRKVSALLFSITIIPFVVQAQTGRDYGWYTEGDYTPAARVKVVVQNELDFDRTDCPVVIPRSEFPLPDISDFFVTVVDPALPPDPEPSEEEIRAVGGWKTRRETNGHYLRYQLDDLDKDGLWDELYFACDIGAGETKTLYVYVQPPQKRWLRGLYPHDTHCVVGNYERNFISWWESALHGWKIAALTDVDMYGKRQEIFISPFECIKNWAGYNRPYEYGMDILLVGDTFGAAGVCLFEESAFPDSVSRPRFSPTAAAGQFNNTRYSRDVVVNGPMRSIILLRIMNWRSGSGLYEIEQYFTAYANKSWSTCRTVFTEFVPGNADTMFGVGMRAIMNENDVFREGGTVISFGRDVPIESPHPDETGAEKLRTVIDFEAIALVVRDEYRPEYRYIESYGGNHAFCIPVTADRTYEYLFAGAWSEGMLNTTAGEFKDYVRKAAEEFNHPLKIAAMQVEHKK